MHTLANALILVAALINLAPVAGALGRERLERAYGVTLDDPDLLVLMRHRAALFGIVGGLMLWGLLDDAIRFPANVAGLASMVSFLILARGEVRAPLKRIRAADIVGIVALGGAFIVDWLGAG